MDAESYSGQDSYRQVDPMIAHARRLMIISPYISNGYARALAARAASGASVRVITSESAVGGSSILIGNYGMTHVRAVLFLVLLDAISIYLGFVYTTIIISFMIAVLGVLSFARRRGISLNMSVKVSRDKFVHEKIYLSDDMAITGSANLTYSGMHRNVEHIYVIRDPARVKELRAHFEGLWASI